MPEPGVTVIQLDIDPEELGRNYPNAVSLIGDAKVTLRHLIDLAGKPSAGAQALARAGCRHSSPMARCRRTADDFKCSANAARARMPRNFRGAPGGWRRRVRYRPLGHVDRADDRIQQPARGFRALCRFARMGLARRDRRQMCAAQSCGRVFHRRRRRGPPSRRTRNRRALRNQSRRRRQQQQFAQSRRFRW